MMKDSGWAWVIATAVMMQNLLVVGLLKSFGLLFVEFIETFQATASMTSAVLGLQAASFCISAPICLHFFSRKCSYRKLMFFGAMTSSAGISMSFVAPNMYFLLFSCGVMIGVGNAFMHGPSLVMIGHYFKRRLSIANSIATGGGSIGQFVFPPLVFILLENYFFRGTLLLIGGMMLNCCVCAALMRPFTENRHDQIGEHSCQIEGKSAEQNPDLEGLMHIPEQSKDEDEGISLDDSSKSSSDFDFRTAPVVTESEEKDERKCRLSKLVDLSLCKSQVFIFLVIALACGNCGSTLHAIYLAPHARDCGINEMMTSVLVTIIGGSDILGKVISGFVADSGLVKSYKLLAVSMIFSGCLAQFLVFFTTLEAIIAYCVIVGMIGGFYYSLLSPVLIDFLGLEQFPRSLGIILSCEGIANTVTPLLLGYLKDETMSYIASFHLIGVMLLVAAFSLILARFVKGRKRVNDSF